MFWRFPGFISTSVLFQHPLLVFLACWKKWKTHVTCETWEVLVTIPHILEMLLLSAEFQDSFWEVDRLRRCHWLTLWYPQHLKTTVCMRYIFTKYTLHNTYAKCASVPSICWWLPLVVFFLARWWSLARKHQHETAINVLTGSRIPISKSKTVYRGNPRKTSLWPYFIGVGLCTTWRCGQSILDYTHLASGMCNGCDASFWYRQCSHKLPSQLKQVFKWTYLFFLHFAHVFFLWNSVLYLVFAWW